MKILTVNRPLQDCNTKLEELQYVEIVGCGKTAFKKIPTWCVKTEMTDNMIDWFKRMEEQVNEHRLKRDINVEGIYLYDITAKDPMIINGKTSSKKIIYYIRWDYIRKFITQ